MNKSVVFLWSIACANMASAELVISEVLYDPSGPEHEQEWIELYNNGPSEVSLDGYALSDNAMTFLLSGTLASEHYYVVARSSAGFQSLYGRSPSASGMELALGNSGDYVRLTHLGIEKDFVAWENEVPGWSVGAKNMSIERYATIDTDTQADWRRSDIETPFSGELSSGNTPDQGGDSGDTNPSPPPPPTNGQPTDPTYYQGTAGLSGNALKARLHDLISQNHHRYSYNAVWDELAIVDRDPANPNNVILLYTNRSVPINSREGLAGSNNNSWNREHVWPKSLGFPKGGQWGYTDLHHLRPANKLVNSRRGNKDFDDGGSQVAEAPDSFSDADSFEPAYRVKGDVARMIFYMDVRYDGQDANMPDLRIVNHTLTDIGDPEIGVLCTLIEWHWLDPVSDFELLRNDRVHERQGNRNPFIDYPAWVDSIWGSQCS